MKKAQPFEVALLTVLRRQDFDFSGQFPGKVMPVMPFWKGVFAVSWKTRYLVSEFCPSSRSILITDSICPLTFFKSEIRSSFSFTSILNALFSD